jgi:hypothetical protein
VNATRKKLCDSAQCARDVAGMMLFALENFDAEGI